MKWTFYFYFYFLFQTKTITSIGLCIREILMKKISSPPRIKALFLVRLSLPLGFEQYHISVRFIFPLFRQSTSISSLSNGSIPVGEYTSLTKISRKIKVRHLFQIRISVITFEVIKISRIKRTIN